ncbi:MAG: hypothetical protein FWG57_08515 [Endomicrobia bacterium]|nr:hypothetical protein [Endomicrobiia bacterium]
MKIIAAITTFIFALPIVLSNFIYLGIPGGSLYFLLYLLFCICFVPLSVFLFILSLFFKKIRETAITGIIVSAVLIMMLLLSILIFKLHDESGFIIGANYNKFNSVKWQKAKFYVSNQREYMLKDLVQNILPNKNIEEMIGLLGDPHAVISGDNAYYLYSRDGDTVFRINYSDKNGNSASYELIDKKSLYKSNIMKGSMIYYITGPGFMDPWALYIFFDEDGIFKEYKLGST